MRVMPKQGKQVQKLDPSRSRTGPAHQDSLRRCFVRLRFREAQSTNAAFSWQEMETGIKLVNGLR